MEFTSVIDEDFFRKVGHLSEDGAEGDAALMGKGRGIRLYWPSAASSRPQTRSGATSFYLHHRVITAPAKPRASVRQRESVWAGRSVVVPPRGERAKVRALGGGYDRTRGVHWLPDAVAARMPQVWRSGAAGPRPRAAKALRAGAASRYQVYAEGGVDPEKRREKLVADDEGEIVVGNLPGLGGLPGELADRRRFWDAVEAHEGPGGRVQSRPTNELPHWFSPAECREAVQSFGRRVFDARGLRWAAAVHRPDRDGDERNQHAHYVYHDRAAMERRGPDGASIVGWDFASRKDRGAQGPRWLKAMRRAWAEEVNRVAQRSQLLPPPERMATPGIGWARTEAGRIPGAVYDPRRYREMGVAKTPTRHLGSRRAALERAGVPTRRGVINALIELSYLERQLGIAEGLESVALAERALALSLGITGETGTGGPELGSWRERGAGPELERQAQRVGDAALKLAAAAGAAAPARLRHARGRVRYELLTGRAKRRRAWLEARLRRLDGDAGGGALGVGRAGPVDRRRQLEDGLAEVARGLALMVRQAARDLAANQRPVIQRDAGTTEPGSPSKDDRTGEALWAWSLAEAKRLTLDEAEERLIARETRAREQTASRLLEFDALWVLDRFQHAAAERRTAEDALGRGAVERGGRGRLEGVGRGEVRSLQERERAAGLTAERAMRRAVDAVLKVSPHSDPRALEEEVAGWVARTGGDGPMEAGSGPLDLLTSDHRHNRRSRSWSRAEHGPLELLLASPELPGERLGLILRPLLVVVGRRKDLSEGRPRSIRRHQDAQAGDLAHALGQCAWAERSRRQAISRIDELESLGGSGEGVRAAWRRRFERAAEEEQHMISVILGSAPRAFKHALNHVSNLDDLAQLLAAPEANACDDPRTTWSAWFEAKRRGVDAAIVQHALFPNERFSSKAPEAKPLPLPTTGVKPAEERETGQSWLKAMLDSVAEGIGGFVLGSLGLEDKDTGQENWNEAHRASLPKTRGNKTANRADSDAAAPRHPGNASKPNPPPASWTTATEGRVAQTMRQVCGSVEPIAVRHGEETSVARLLAGLSSEALAERAKASVAFVGYIFSQRLDVNGPRVWSLAREHVERGIRLANAELKARGLEGVAVPSRGRTGNLIRPRGREGGM